MIYKNNKKIKDDYREDAIKALFKWVGHTISFNEKRIYVNNSSWLKTHILLQTEKKIKDMRTNYTSLTGKKWETASLSDIESIIYSLL